MNKFKHIYSVRTVANDVAFVYTGAQSPNFIWKVRTELVSQTPVSWFMIPDDPIRRRPPPATKKKCIYICMSSSIMSLPAHTPCMVNVAKVLLACWQSKFCEQFEGVLQQAFIERVCPKKKCFICSSRYMGDSCCLVASTGQTTHLYIELFRCYQAPI